MPFTGAWPGEITDSEFDASIEIDWVKGIDMKEVEVQKITLQPEEIVTFNNKKNHFQPILRIENGSFL